MSLNRVWVYLFIFQDLLYNRFNKLGIYRIHDVPFEVWMPHDLPILTHHERFTITLWFNDHKGLDAFCFLKCSFNATEVCKDWVDGTLRHLVGDQFVSEQISLTLRAGCALAPSLKGFDFPTSPT